MNVDEVCHVTVFVAIASYSSFTVMDCYMLSFTPGGGNTSSMNRNWSTRAITCNACWFASTTCPRELTPTNDSKRPKKRGTSQMADNGDGVASTKQDSVDTGIVVPSLDLSTGEFETSIFRGIAAKGLFVRSIPICLL